MVIIEAMAIGLPVVASDHIGPRSIVNHEHNGFLVPQGSVSGYAQYIRLLSQDSNKWGEMSANARITARRYTLDSVTVQWLELLDGCTIQDSLSKAE